MNINHIKEIKKTLKLTKRQREILTGKLLGDAYVKRVKQTARICFEHSLSQKAYVDWLYDEFKNWSYSPPKIKLQSDQYMYKSFLKYGFRTYSHGSLRFYAQQFYPKEKKVIPKLIHRWLTPLALAVWFMDSGSIKSRFHKARIINTQGFQKNEIERLRIVLKNNFGIETKLRNQKEGYQIMILAESSKQFAKIVKPYMHKSMLYKLKGLE